MLALLFGTSEHKCDESYLEVASYSLSKDGCRTELVCRCCGFSKWV